MLAKKGPQLAAAILPFPESRQAANTQPQYTIERSFDFVRAEWPGYEHCRTSGEKDGKDSLLDRSHAGARTWELSPRASES